jgi:hypothetical protein
MRSLLADGTQLDVQGLRLDSAGKSFRTRDVGFTKLHALVSFESAIR